MNEELKELFALMQQRPELEVMVYCENEPTGDDDAGVWTQGWLCDPEVSFVYSLDERLYFRDSCEDVSDLLGRFVEMWGEDAYPGDYNEFYICDFLDKYLPWQEVIILKVRSKR